MKTILILMTVFTVGLTAAEPSDGQRQWARAYAWSTSAVSGATAADMASSFRFTHDGQREANGFLAGSGGGYGMKGAMIQSGLTGGSLILQRLLIRKHPGLRIPFQIMNVRHNLDYAGRR